MNTDPPSTAPVAAPEAPAEPPGQSEVPVVADAPQPKEKFVLKVVGTALGLVAWGLLLGASYALLSYENPEIETGVGFTLIMASYTALPVLVILAVVALVIRTHHAQKIVYWTTVVLFTIAGCLAAYFTHAFSDPSLEF